MPTATYEPQNTTGSSTVLTDAEPSFSALPSGDDFVLIPGGWLPREQEYYWTEQWQADEQETLRELAAGGGIDFETTEDLLRWLFSADED